ncbi:ribbon-helix-helix protein, CopG family [Brumimicrobium glaciale]|uniref:Ribbon-helix-helix protein, CopG family n=1 Tax=Brumimicrobium glaciale TaxID=200475 RepID=A0A4Q4KNF8_9FLAO|nr:ribbon-helix-helix protein, CopG family [Brumimicrobium glaciale]RYM34971.1 ribbon-helix-helix protein, CopG family [Brumimicrobium glaciale]
MSDFTISLPSSLLRLLEEKAIEMGVDKNILIEKALNNYLDELNRKEYIKSFRRMRNDKDLLAISEEGMDDYARNII